jgi:hypothetical protein
VTPDTFCAAIRRELTTSLAADEAWMRGATGLCDMYAAATPERFESILEQTARGANGSALAEGARWLLARWRAAVRSA